MAVNVIFLIRLMHCQLNNTPLPGSAPEGTKIRGGHAKVLSIETHIIVVLTEYLNWEESSRLHHCL